MSRVARPLPAHLGEEFSVRDALSNHVSAKRLRGPDLASPFYGARILVSHYVPTPTNARVLDDRHPLAKEAEALTAELRHLIDTFSQIAAPDWFFCHAAAAVVWKLPLPIRLLRRAMKPSRVRGATVPPRGVDVGVVAPGRATKAAGTRGRKISPWLVSIRTRDGLRVSSPESTWAMLADELTVDELVEVGDAIVQIPRRKGMQRGTAADALGTMAGLAAAANAPYRRHARKLLAALAQIRVGSSSPGETKTRLASERAGLPQPMLDFDVFAPDGRPIGFTEIAYPEYHVLVEYEGDHHRTDRGQWQRDVDKHAMCVDAGYEVVRLTARHVHPSTEPAIRRIRAALIRGGWQPPREN
jgi:hypothetical protein